MNDIQRIFRSGYNADQWLKFNYMQIFESLWSKDYMHYVPKYKQDKRLFSFYNKLDKENRILLLEYLNQDSQCSQNNQDEQNIDDLKKCLEITSYVCHNMYIDNVQRLINNAYELNVQNKTFDLSGFLTSLNNNKQKEVCDEYSAYLYNK